MQLFPNPHLLEQCSASFSFISFQQIAGLPNCRPFGTTLRGSGGSGSGPSICEDRRAKGDLLGVRFKCNRNLSKLRTKARVPNTYQITAYRQFSAFVARIVFNNVFVFSMVSGFKSLSLCDLTTLLGNGETNAHSLRIIVQCNGKEASKANASRASGPPTAARACVQLSAIRAQHPTRAPSPDQGCDLTRAST